MSQVQVKHGGGTEPTDKMKRRITGQTLTLEDLFVTGRNVENEFRDHMLDVALTKLRSVFRPDEVIGNPRARRPKWTDHYLPSMDGSVDQLVHLIGTQVGNRRMSNFVRWDDLPPVYQGLNDFWLERVRAEARRLLLQEVIAQLVGKSLLWYHEKSKLWQAAQSVVDPRPRSHKHAIKWDKRPWHGRPPRDRKRGVRVGTSVGNSR